MQNLRFNISTTNSETEDLPEKWYKSWVSKKNVIIISAIIAFIVILAFLALSGINLGEIFIRFTFWYGDLFGSTGIYLALYLISIFANMTVIFPLPYTLALSVIIFIKDVNIILLGISAGTGAAIGEITAYYVGKGGASLTDTSKSVSIEKMKKRIKKGYAVPLMFLCAATPIPDDQLLLLLGFAGYSIWKMLITYFFGKITLCLWTAYLIKFAWDIPAFGSVFSIFGIDKQAINEYSLTGHYESSINPWISFIAWVTVLLLFIALFYIDWMSIFRRIFKRTKNISEKNGLNMVFLPLITKL
ncbi:MAG: hypothetical protein ACTSYZ_10500 [Candidatus Helarchaeota archaeon]